MAHAENQRRWLPLHPLHAGKMLDIELAEQQAVLLGQLVAVVGNLQNAVATNSNLIVGNTGAVATGPQTANPVNVRA
jgi:hypothetical protein